jgi:hypothetical protein
MGLYADIIREQLDGRDYDPRHVEAYMRLQYGTLDHLDRATFNNEVEICVDCIEQDGAINAESLAESYGL